MEQEEETAGKSQCKHPKKAETTPEPITSPLWQRSPQGLWLVGSRRASGPCPPHPRPCTPGRQHSHNLGGRREGQECLARCHHSHSQGAWFPAQSQDPGRSQNLKHLTPQVYPQGNPSPHPQDPSFKVIPPPHKGRQAPS